MACLCIDLFAEGNDFSSATIDRNRNLFYQKRVTRLVAAQMNEIISWLTHALQSRLNVGQSFVSNSSSAIFLLQIVADLAALYNTKIYLTDDARLTIHSRVSSLDSVATPRYAIRVSDE
jgi:hypothetical protein